MLTGHCLCNGVRYEIHGSLDHIVNCHCESCRRAQGGAFATNSPVNDSLFRLVLGAELVTEYESSPGKFRCFCRTCGSPLWSRRTSLPAQRRIRMGLLDSDPGKRPVANFCVGEKAPWYEISDGLPSYADNYPGGKNPLKS